MKRWFLMCCIVFYGITGGILGAQAAEVNCSLNDGQKADGKSVLEYQGVKHEFCCSGCLQKFKDNPQLFADQFQKSQQINTTDAEAEVACSSLCSK